MLSIFRAALKKKQKHNNDVKLKRETFSLVVVTCFLLPLMSFEYLYIPRLRLKGVVGGFPINLNKGSNLIFVATWGLWMDRQLAPYIQLLTFRELLALLDRRVAIRNPVSVRHRYQFGAILQSFRGRVGS